MTETEAWLKISLPESDIALLKSMYILSTGLFRALWGLDKSRRDSIAFLDFIYKFKAISMLSSSGDVTKASGISRSCMLTFFSVSYLALIRSFEFYLAITSPYASSSLSISIGRWSLSAVCSRISGAMLRLSPASGELIIWSIILLSKDSSILLSRDSVSLSCSLSISITGLGSTSSAFGENC